MRERDKEGAKGGERVKKKEGGGAVAEPPVSRPNSCSRHPIFPPYTPGVESRSWGALCARLRVKSGRAGPVGGGESEEGTTNGPEEGGARRCVPTPAPPVPEGGDAQGDTPVHTHHCAQRWLGHAVEG
jgi:hypothetical protein